MLVISETNEKTKLLNYSSHTHLISHAFVIFTQNTPHVHGDQLQRGEENRRHKVLLQLHMKHIEESDLDTLAVAGLFIPRVLVPPQLVEYELTRIVDISLNNPGLEIGALELIHRDEESRREMERESGLEDGLVVKHKQGLFSVGEMNLLRMTERMCGDEDRSHDAGQLLLFKIACVVYG